MGVKSANGFFTFLGGRDVSTPAPQDVTIILQAVQEGDESASERLLPLVYDELRKLARRRMANEPSDHTLQATALVHEAYLRLVGGQHVAWDNRGHFFGAAARAMRRILLERARKYARIKHGAERQRVSLDEGKLALGQTSEDVLALDEALDRLEKLDPRKSEIVHLRYFAGLTIEETAEALGVSPATVKNDWKFAKAWLYAELRESDESAD